MIDRKSELRHRLETVRNQTLALLAQVPDDFLARRVHSFYSPIGWHFGHVGRTEDYWVMVRALGKAPYDADLDFLYTDRPDNPKDARIRVPGREATIRYLTNTRERILDALEATDLQNEDPILRDGYAWDFAIQHECQHQETICEMLHLIQCQLSHAPVASLEPSPFEAPNFLKITGGEFEAGSGSPMAYDNEKMPHSVRVESFLMAKHAVTVSDWWHFLADGGYQRSELWSQLGWQWVQDGQIQAPEYWRAVSGGWATIGMNGLRSFHPQEPVLGISHFEAEAYAVWAGARLPNEVEWEYAARYGHYPWGDEQPGSRLARFGIGDGSPAPVGIHPAGDTPDGISDLAGNGWEWTSSPFLPYPGFEAFPYDGYSKDHMQGSHRVCRGGSFATAGPILRRTFRNWYVPAYRQGFLGVRLVKSL